MYEHNAQLIDKNENLATYKVRVPSQNYALISIVSSISKPSFLFKRGKYLNGASFKYSANVFMICYL